MKNQPALPVYAQIAYDIAAKIACGEIKEQERFSGRSLMGAQYRVSPETIRRAMRLLSDMGITEIRENVGSVVLSKARAVEYVEQYQAGSDMSRLKCELRTLIEERDRLNEKITETYRKIFDLSERFRHSDRLRTYEFLLPPESPVAGKDIGTLRFRQQTGATVVAVRRGEEICLSPGPGFRFEPQDILIVACEITQIALVSALLGCPPA